MAMTAADNYIVLRLCVLIFSSFQLAVLMRELLGGLRERKRSQYFRKLAYTDGLTGLLNRYAFKSTLANIRLNSYEYRDLICVFVDINNLKYVNDTYGHIEGDEIICTVCRLLCKKFEACGSVYRYGGDEFILLLRGVDEAFIIRAKNELYEELREAYSSSGTVTGIAVGYEKLCDIPAYSIDKCMCSADRKMYREKQRQKGLLGSPAEVKTD